MKAHRTWQRRHDTAAPKVGDLAPDFELFDVHGGSPIHLSDFQGRKPVALVFGSFT
jgi:peroxiredoxin